MISNDFTLYKCFLIYLLIAMKITAMEKPEKNNDALLLRLPTGLKADLQKQADINGRRITAEINTRLRNSLEQEATPAPGIAPALSTNTLPPGYTNPIAQHIVECNEKGPANYLSGIDQAMLDVFHTLPPEKQLALLSLFR